MKVFVTEEIHPDALKLLEENVEVVHNMDDIEHVDAILVRAMPITKEIIDKAKNLKLIAKHGVGYDNIDVEYAKSKGIPVTNTPAANGNSVAELIVGLIMSLARFIPINYIKCRNSEYTEITPEETKGIEVAGKTLGLIGLGNIAQQVGRMMKAAFNVSIVGYDPYVSAEKCAEMGIKKYETVEELVANADIVSISVPLTKGTRNLLSDKQFDCFKPTGLLVNAARGGVVDEEALYRALTQGKLRAAACDVFVKEPPTAENPLMHLDNFVGTPHVGGGTYEALRRVAMTAAEEVIGVLNGKEPMYPVYR